MSNAVRSSLLLALLTLFLVGIHSTTVVAQETVPPSELRDEERPLDEDGLPLDQQLPPLRHQPEAATSLTDLASAESTLRPLVSPVAEAVSTLLPVTRGQDTLLLPTG